MRSHLAPPRAIPWQFSTYGDFVQYEWEQLGEPNATFHAQLLRQNGAWSWSLEAGPATNPLWRIGGAGPDKATCEELVCEAIAKAFSATGPYRELVDPAGRRYTIANGRRVDLGELEGCAVRVGLVTGEQMIGLLHVGGWNILLADTGRTFSVNPTLVTAVERQ